VELLAVGVCAIAIIAGDAENAKFEQQQTQSRMMFRPYFTKLFPDLRAAQRFGKEREDKESVHIWVCVDTQGGSVVQEIPRTRGWLISLPGRPVCDGHAVEE
jgi:hypothetical protein